MTLRFTSLASGSRGNALLVEHEDTLIMIDCGLPLKTLSERMAAVDRTLDDLDAVLITHEHGDHSRGIGPLRRRVDVPLWTTPGTAHAVCAAANGRSELADFERVSCRSELRIGSIRVQPFPVPHDAREPCQFLFRAGRARLGVLTDTGHATPVISEALADCDAIAIEFNHDQAMLAGSSYPESVKARVGSRFGHLNNDQASALLSGLIHAELQWIAGLHLSERNNSPALVRAAAEPITDRAGIELHLAAQDEVTGWLSIA